jgi:Cdc6-like AAA superfamily ATPase
MEVLHSSFTPGELLCRSSLLDKISQFIRNAITNNNSGRLIIFNESPHFIFLSLYICGAPGTGKTASVTEVLNKLKNEV